MNRPRFFPFFPSHRVLKAAALGLFLLAATPATAFQTAIPEVEIVNGCRIERFEVASPTMGRQIRAWALPPPAYGNDEKQFPLLITLHGRGAPYDSWAKMSPLQQGLAQKPMIVAGFDADAASWYVDSPLQRQSQFETFFFAEFLPALDKRFRLKPQKSLTGFSMGGFGALHFALRRPELFASVSALSGAFRPLDPPDARAETTFTPLLGTYLDNPAVYRSLDLFGRLSEQKTTFPPLYLECGTEDPLLNSSRNLNTAAQKQGLKVELHDSPGAHDWAFWKAASARVLDFHWANQG